MSHDRPSRHAASERNGGLVGIEAPELAVGLGFGHQRSNAVTATDTGDHGALLDLAGHVARRATIMPELPMERAWEARRRGSGQAHELARLIDINSKFVPVFLEQMEKVGSINERDILIFGELMCIGSEVTCGDEVAAICAFSLHGTEQISPLMADGSRSNTKYIVPRRRLGSNCHCSAITSPRAL